MLLVSLAVIVLLAGCARLGLSSLQGESVAGGVNRIDGAGQLADCPDTPNCVSTQASDADHRVDTLDYTLADERVVPALEAWLNDEKQATVVSVSEDYLHATFTTPMMGFTDDVEFLRQGGGTLQVRSASRLGYSDLGANRRRVETLRTELAEVLRSAP